MKNCKPIFAALMSLVVLTACSTPQDISSSEQTISDPFATTAPVTEELSPKDKAKEYVDTISRTSLAPVVTIDGSKDFIFDYNGGNIDITFNADYTNKSRPKPELMTLGVSVTLNGIYQNISVNGSENTQMYTQEYPLTENGEYPKPTMNISFDPVIAEQDKNEDGLALMVIVTYNPHFRVNPDYPSAGGAHTTISITSYICNVKTPILNYSDTKIETGFEKILITDAVVHKYSNIHSEMGFTQNRATLFDRRMINAISLTDEGKAEVGVLLTAEISGIYRVYFLVNGKPAKLESGADCVEVDAEVGYLYYLDCVEIADAKAYDTIKPYAIKSASEFDELERSDAEFPFVIMPHEE
ncbi:MAG: hypothetical protein IJZ72_10285 [Oscillospiraceae bacterium]|nr:hypothetical protein [Oscillospiraceae bacterium]